MKVFRRFPAGWLLITGLVVGLHLLNAQHAGMPVQYAAAASRADTGTNCARATRPPPAAPRQIANAVLAKDENYGGKFDSAFDFPTDALWLQITGITNGVASLILNNATNQVYEVLSKTDLTLTNWTIEPGVVWPTNAMAMPFTVSVLERARALFIRAADWTGVTENGNATPDWWFWKYFGTLTLWDTNLDSQGNTLLYDYTNGFDPNVILFSILATNHDVNDCRVPVQLNISRGVPGYISIVDSTNFIPSTGSWSSYPGSNIVINLDPVEGPHLIWIGLRGLPADARQTWQMMGLTLDTTAPVLGVSSPAGNTVSQPLIQVQGLVNEPLSSLSYDVSNAVSVVAGQPGYITGRYYDTNSMAFTTNYFQCYDLALADGCNTITLHATDLAGNTASTSVSYTLDYSNDNTPPALTILWPPDGASISGTQFTLQAQVDDDNAVVAAQIVDANGGTNIVRGSVQRDGTVWVKDLPLGAGQNTVTLTATDNAGNSSVTGITVHQSAVIVTMNPLSSGQGNQSSVTVSGTISDAGYSLTVNGVSATVNSDGTWSADNVPVTTTGKAVFDVEAQAGTGSEMMFLPMSSPPGNSQQFSQSQPASVALVAYTWNTGHWENLHATDYDIWQNDEIIEHVTQDCWQPRTYLDSESWDGTNYVRDTSWDIWNGHCVDPVTHRSTVSGYLKSVSWEQSAYGYYDETFEGGDNGPPDYTPWRDWGHERDKIELDTGTGTPGTTKTFLILVDGVYYVKAGGSWWGVPMPPGWLKIHGKTLIDTGEANVWSFGQTWGAAVLQLPADTKIDITPSTYETGNYDFDVRAIELEPPAVDANRDGQISFDARDQTTAYNPYRFWVNNDHDGYDGSIDDYDDLNPSAGLDANNLAISCPRDLEDYARLWINTKGLTTELQNGSLLLALEWKDAVDDPQMQFFQAAETDGGALYLTDSTTAARQVSNYGTHIIEFAHRNILSRYNPFIFPPGFWANLSDDQPVAHLLFDAVSRGNGQLVVAIYKNDGRTKLAEGPPLYLKLQDVKEMYDRWTVGDDPSSPPAARASLVTAPYSYDSTIPAENNYILFVHGWNLADWEKDAFAETAFKRLYWQGYQGRFGAFQWPTGYGFGSWKSVVTDPDNFDNSEFNAWNSGPGLENLLASLNGIYPGHVYLFAHSMGNVVAGEALKLAGSNQVVDTYIAMQGAIASHCYDPTADFRGIRSLLDDGTPNRYGNYPTNGGPCYFDGMAGARNFINFYNPDDWALNGIHWQLDQDLKPDGGFGWDGLHFYMGYLEIQIDLPAYTYKIFAYCDETRCYALGAQANVGGAFKKQQVDLHALFGFGDQHKDHSGEFNSNNMNRWQFWQQFLLSTKLTRPK
ncbi:MAG TPA: alpha/beta hydrolase [Verrucomicrobiae bacterium]|nr:alpha/beta hydrolase [Verrucomicrobiae bacterium]